MAIIRKKELKQMSKNQINQKLTEMRNELMRINTKKSTGTSIENPGRVKELKRTIARLLTRFNENLEEAKQKA